MQAANWIIYGNNPLAEILACEACRLGHQPILAGSDEAFVLPLAAKLNIAYRIFPLHHSHQIQQFINDVALFTCCDFISEENSRLLQQACLQNSCHYLDVLPRQVTDKDIYKQQGIVLLGGCNFYSLLHDVLAANNAIGIHFTKVLPTLWQALLLTLAQYQALPNTDQIYVNFQHDKQASLLDFLLQRFAYYRKQKIKKAWQKLENSEQEIILNIAYESEEQVLHIAPPEVFFTHSMMVLIEATLAHKILPGVYNAADTIAPEDWLAMQIFQYGKPLFEISEITT